MTTDYNIPTTAEVREAYVYDSVDTTCETATYPEAEVAFDRWLREHDAKIWNEGFDAGHYVNAQESRDCDCRKNPYRGQK